MKHASMLLMVVLLWTVAWSQDDPVLQSYGLAFDSLNRAVEALASDTELARSELERAAGTLRPLSSDATSTTLLSALESTFERARTAIQNQSPVDLKVQVSVLQGGFWRLVYESALRDTERGEAELVTQRFVRLSQDMALSEASRLALTDAPARSALAAFEQGIAQEVSLRLNSVGTLAATNIGAAYEQLASAYSLFLPVQDSPRVSAAAATLFAQSFPLLIASDQEALTEIVGQLSEQMQLFEKAAAEVVRTASILPAGTEASEVVSEAASEEASQVETAQAPVETAPVETSDVAATPAVEAATALTPETEVGVQDAAVAEATGVTPQITETAAEPPSTPVTAALPTASSSTLMTQMARFGLAPARQERLTEQFLERGYVSINDVVTDLYADSAKAIVALQAGDEARTKSLINGFKDRYTELLDPLVNNRDPVFNAGMLRLLDALRSAPSLRLQDLVVLTGQVDAAAAVLGGSQVSLAQSLSAGTTSIWAGWLRLAAMIVLGTLAFVPLYLLYLAFGGGNRNWQLVGWALFMLLLPLMYEGLTYVTSLLSSLLGGVAWLEAPARFSILQSSVSQLIWAIVSGIAIALAFAGLYGICVQFGLLGQRSSSTKTVATTETKSTNTGATTSFDWDEEF